MSQVWPAQTLNDSTNVYILVKDFHVVHLTYVSVYCLIRVYVIIISISESDPSHITRYFLSLLYHPPLYVPMFHNYWIKTSFLMNVCLLEINFPSADQSNSLVPSSDIQFHDILNRHWGVILQFILYQFQYHV